MRKLMKNPLAVFSITVLTLIIIVIIVAPMIIPYGYADMNTVNGKRDKTATNMTPFQYSELEQEYIAQGGSRFPHIFGTDSQGRDYFIRCVYGTRVSLSVGLVASIIVLIIGMLYGSIAGYFGGRLDLIMMRIVDIIYTIPDVLLIVLLSFALKAPLASLATMPGMKWINVVGENMISIFVVFALLYWVGMARMVRSQILMLKESEYVTAAKALGAGSARIIRKHLLTNCIGTLIVTTTLQIPSSIFTESYLSFLGLGVAVPLPSLGSLASTAINGMATYPYLLIAPSVLISLIILSFNLFGDGLRDAFDPKMKK
jgi:oligopeptide transport system permease protein